MTKTIVLCAAGLLAAGIGAAEGPAPPDTNGRLAPAAGREIVGPGEAPVVANHEGESAPLEKGAVNDIALGSWNITAPQVGPFDPIVTAYTGSEILVRPNAANPTNSFGYLEGPVVFIPDGDDPDDLLVFEVLYSYTYPYSGVAPVLRLRLNTESFSEYAEAGLVDGRLQREQGLGVARLYFDRNALNADTGMRFYIDLNALNDPALFMDPNFEYQIERTSYYFVEGGSGGTPSGDRWTAAYMERDGDLFAHLNGNVGRFKLDSTVNDYAYSEFVVAAIDDEELVAYSVENPQATINIDNTVTEVAVSGYYVAYIQFDGDVKQYDMRSNQRINVAENANGVGAGPDGTTFFVLDGPINGIYWDVFQWDPRDSNAPLERLTEEADDLLNLRGRQSQHY